MTQPNRPPKNRSDRWHEPACGLGLREDLLAAIGTDAVDVHLRHHLAAVIAEHCCPTSPFRAHRLAWGWRRVDDAVDALLAVRDRRGRCARGMTTALWRQWEEGRHRPDHDYLDSLCELFETSAVRLGFAPDYTPKKKAGSGEDRFRRVILAGRGWAGRPDEVMDTERRTFFGAAGFAVGVPMLTGPDLLRHALDLGSVSADRLDWIEREAQQIAYQKSRVPDPTVLLGPARSHFETVSGLLTGPQRMADKVRLTRTAAVLAGTIGQIRFDQGHLQESEDWLRAAHSAAVEAGDQYLTDMAIVAMTMVPVYRHRPSEVLSLVEPRLDRSSARPTIGSTKLHAMAARAHAEMGDRPAYQRELDRARADHEAAPVPDIEVWQPFGPAQLEFYAANAAGHLGDIDAAADATDQAVALFDPGENTDRTIARFDKAKALRLSGEAEEACRVAIAAISDPNMYFGTSVRTRAEEFGRRLGHTTAAVREYREAYHTILARSPDGPFSGA